MSQSLSGKYPWERYEPPYPPSYGLNSTTTVLSRRMTLALNNLKRVDMPLKQRNETKPLFFEDSKLSIVMKPVNHRQAPS